MNKFLIKNNKVIIIIILPPSTLISLIQASIVHHFRTCFFIIDAIRRLSVRYGGTSHLIPLSGVVCDSLTWAAHAVLANMPQRHRFPTECHMKNVSESVCVCARVVSTMCDILMEIPRNLCAIALSNFHLKMSSKCLICVLEHTSCYRPPELLLLYQNMKE